MIKENFVKLYENSFKKNWDLPALSEYAEKKTYLYKDLANEIARLHILFEHLDIHKGDKIALIGKNTIHWCSTYLAAITYGAVIVPILQDFHPDNIHHIVNHSESVLLFTSDSIWEGLDEEYIPQVKGVFSLSGFSCIYSRDTKHDINKLLKEWDALMKVKYPQGFDVNDIKYAEVDNSEVVLINYTSGTTGFSKGVMLMANNLAGNVTYAKKLELLFREQRMLSFLPLAHAYGCAFDFLFALSEGVHTTLLGKAPSPKILSAAFAEVKPHLIISVPLVIEKIYKKAILPKLEKKSLQLALKVPIINNRIYAKIRKSLMEALGGEFSHVIIGGAALNKEVENFLYKIKFPFTVGYGMTECGPLISYDHYYDFVPSSCGKVLSIMEVRVDSPDPYNQIGEIQVRGENVMKGYYKNPEATKDVFSEDGWLRTGDLGTIDKDNRIYLRGRSKTMILGPSGQNIFPEEIEARLNNMPYVMESLVVTRNEKLVALVYPDYEAMDAVNLSTQDLDKAMEENKILLNKQVANYETISAIHIYPTEFEKTPKKSIKRYLYEK
jgi:long-chain acyl-CoA synthetase